MDLEGALGRQELGVAGGKILHRNLSGHEIWQPSPSLQSHRIDEPIFESQLAIEL